jgi:DMSO/TMAO reductase YedYZ heme-binding membrane subunit
MHESMEHTVIGTVDSRVWWWLTRASGIVALSVVATAVVWGLLTSTKLIRRRGAPAWMLDLHRYLGTLTLAFVIIHVAAVSLDSFVRFDARQLFVPFASTWRPHAIAFGIVSMYLLVAIQTTSWFMRRLPRKLWHRVHVLSIPMLALAIVHAVLAGTDRTNRALQWSALGIAALIVFLLGVRVLAPSRPVRSVTPSARPAHASEKIAV